MRRRSSGRGCVARRCMAEKYDGNIRSGRTLPISRVLHLDLSSNWMAQPTAQRKKLPVTIGVRGICATMVFVCFDFVMWPSMKISTLSCVRSRARWKRKSSGVSTHGRFRCADSAAFSPPAPFSSFSRGRTANERGVEGQGRNGWGAALVTATAPTGSRRCAPLATSPAPLCFAGEGRHSRAAHRGAGRFRREKQAGKANQTRFRLPCDRDTSPLYTPRRGKGFRTCRPQFHGDGPEGAPLGGGQVAVA